MSEHKRDQARRHGGPMGGGPMAGMAMPGEKAKDFKGTLGRLAGYLKPRKFQLIAVFAMAVLSTLFSIVSPKILGKATTKIFEGIMGIVQKIPGAHIDYTYIVQILLVLAGL
ncbi:hypothetical protein ABNC33_21270 [Paenibacillus larvae]